MVLMSSLVGSLFYLRARTASFQSQREWDAWRGSELHSPEHDGPVQRKVPKSQRPPLTALLADHFATCVAGAIVFGTALFVTFGFMIQGVWRGHQIVIHDDSGGETGEA